MKRILNALACLVGAVFSFCSAGAVAFRDPVAFLALVWVAIILASVAVFLFILGIEDASKQRRMRKTAQASGKEA